MPKWTSDEMNLLIDLINTGRNGVEIRQELEKRFSTHRTLRACSIQARKHGTFLSRGRKVPIEKKPPKPVITDLLDLRLIDPVEASVKQDAAFCSAMIDAGYKQGDPSKKPGTDNPRYMHPYKHSSLCSSSMAWIDTADK
jgi:hypothetical protein